MGSNSSLQFDSGHLRRWKENVSFGQYRRIRKNCTLNSDFETQAKIIQKRFSEKGYPESLTKQAYKRAKHLTQEQCLDNSKKEIPFMKTQKERTNFITTYNVKHGEITIIMKKYCFFLKKDPILKDIIPRNPSITYKRPPTLKNILAPSHLRKHTLKPKTTLTPGVYKCNRP